MLNIIFLYELFCLMFYMLTGRFKIKCKPFQNARRILLITAHPDDESMFFGPVIMKLKQERSQIYLLCLSTGDAYNLGAKRKQELWDACDILGIPSSNITLFKNSRFPDDPTVLWDESQVASLILNQIEIIQADVVITFDEEGCLLYTSLCKLCLCLKLSNQPLLAWKLNDDSEAVSYTHLDVYKRQWLDRTNSLLGGFVVSSNLQLK